MTLCEKCLHAEVCAIRDGHEEGDERALKYCSDFRGWISVDERLPEDKQMCLAYGTVYYVPDEHSKEIMVTKFYEEFGFIEQIHAHITHWMPLTEPPKMKGDEGHA